jgi:hypothetical protein
MGNVADRRRFAHDRRKSRLMTSGRFGHLAPGQELR